MNQQSAEATTQRTRLVTVTIDGKAKEIERGKYLVSDLKLVLGVPADYELDEVKHGEFKPLDENGHSNTTSKPRTSSAPPPRTPSRARHS